MSPERLPDDDDEADKREDVPHAAEEVKRVRHAPRREKQRGVVGDVPGKTERENNPTYAGRFDPSGHSVHSRNQV